MFLVIVWTSMMLRVGNPAGFIAVVHLVRVVGLRVGGVFDRKLCLIVIVPVVGGTLVAGGLFEAVVRLRFAAMDGTVLGVIAAVLVRVVERIVKVGRVER